jgi:universal stress protein A
VVSVDFSDASDYALELAKDLVRPARQQADLHLVHVASPLYWPVGAAPTLAVPDVQEFVTSTCERLIAACFPDGVDLSAAVAAHVRIGEATREISNLAREVQADLIVIGAHRRGALASILHRSMSASLVRHSPCSVLTAIPREHGPGATDSREVLHHEPLAHGSWSFRP